MPQRFTTLIIAGLALLAVAPAAAAGALAPPHDAPVVAGPTTSGIVLTAWTRGEELCLAARRPRPGSTSAPTRAADTVAVPDLGADCVATPVLTPSGLSWRQGATERLRLVYGVAGSAVASVERHGPEVATQRSTTQPLPGSQGDLRAFVLDRAVDAPDGELRLLGFDGGVLRAVDEDRWDIDAGDRARGPVLQRGGAGRARWELHGFGTSHLAPTPLAPLRRTGSACAQLVLLRDGPETSLCGGELRFGAPAATQVSTGCGDPIGSWAFVLAREPARRAEVVLGDGHRRSFALHELPAGLRAGVLVLGFGRAVRSVRVMSAAGGVMAAFAVQRPPSQRRCANASSEWGTLAADPPVRTPPPATSAAVTATDRGEDLCLDLEPPTSDVAACRLPPVAPEDVRLSTRTTTSGTLAYAAVPLDVTGLDVRLDDGTTLHAAARPLPAYAGKYGDVTRFASVLVPAGRQAERYALRDARGRLVGGDLVPSAEQPQADEPVHTRVVLRATRDQPPVRVGAPTLRIPGRIGGPCVAFTPLGSNECRVLLVGEIAVRALCAPRRIVVVGTLPHASDRLAIRTADGRLVASRSAVTRGPGRPYRIAVAVLGADAAPRALVLRGPDAVSEPLRLPRRTPAVRLSHARLLGARIDGLAPGRARAAGRVP